MAGHFVLEERPQAGAGARAPDDGQALSGAGAALQILITADHESAARGPAEAGSESPLAQGTRMSWRGRGPSHPQLTDSSPRKAQGPGSKRPGGQSSNSKRRTSVGLGSGQAILVTQLCSWGPRSEGVACGCHRWVLGGGRGSRLPRQNEAGTNALGEGPRVVAHPCRGGETQEFRPQLGQVG